MKRKAGLTGMALSGMLCLPLTVLGDHPAGVRDWFWIEADVVAVEPMLRTVHVTTPREVCWQEPVRYTASNRRYRSHTPKIIGGIIGGIVGNQFGRGSGNTAMTAAGALLGASVARDAQQRRYSSPHGYVRSEERCRIEEVVHEEERVDGYRVIYEYNGRTFETRSRTEPGDTIRVRVRLEPLG